jgi:four helix bundle protein
VLNYIDGYARQRKAIKDIFWEIFYGSLRESKYLLGFCAEEKYLTNEDYQFANDLAEEIGAMLYHFIRA